MSTIQLGYYVNSRGKHEFVTAYYRPGQYLQAFRLWKGVVNVGRDSAFWYYKGNGVWEKLYASEHYPSDVKRPIHSEWAKVSL